MKGRINRHTKGTLKDTNKMYLYSYKTLAQSKIWKKLNLNFNKSHINYLRSS